MVATYRVGPETERLYHRAPVVDDAEEWFARNSHPDVVRYTGEDPLTSLAAARERIENHKDFETIGYGRWACFLKETGALIGFCGLKYLDDLDEVDVGYRFLPEYWGKGLGTEACRASLRFGFEEIGLSEIIGLVLPENTASVRVLEKSGLKSDGDFIYDGERTLRFVMRESPAQRELGNE